MSVLRTDPTGRAGLVARIAQPTGSGEYVRRRVVARIINRHCPTGGRVVDMGAGVGNLYFALRRDLRHRYTVVDVQRAGYGLRIGGDVTAAPLAGGSADFVCLSDVLEHLVHDADAVQEAVRAARPGAHVVLHVPSTRTKPYAFLQRAADGAEAIDHQQFPHVRDGYIEDTLRSMLGEVAGVDIVNLEPSFAPRQSLLSDIDAYLWWHKWTPLRVVPWLGIRLASRRAMRPVPAESSSGYVALLRKSPA